ncbi:MAG: helix-turn-helix transcriptional regulator [Colwellia sp.]|nr:helix-turn-helix transcriptional regulator [Colwellia sp.]
MSKYVELNSNKIQKLRTQKCWSQDELASVSGLSIRTIQRVEKAGNASLETVKALASVFEVEPAYLQSSKEIQQVTFNFICKHAWLVAFAVSSVFFGLWIVDILIPTLKGADFNNQYEIHGNFRYLDFGGISFFVGFIFLGFNVFVDFINSKKVSKGSTKGADA